MTTPQTAAGRAALARNHWLTDVTVLAIEAEAAAQAGLRLGAYHLALAALVAAWDAYSQGEDFVRSGMADALAAARALLGSNDRRLIEP